MKIINNQVWLHFDDLVGAGVSELTLKTASSRNRVGWDFIEDPSDKRKVLVCWDTLKPKYRQRVMGWLGCEPSEWLKNAAKAKALQVGLEAVCKIDLQEQNNLIQLLGAEKGRIAARKAAVYRLYNNCKGKNDVQKLKIGCTTKAELLQLITDWESKLQEKDKSPNTKVVQRRMLQYEKSGYIVLVHGNLGNENAKVVTEDMLKRVAELWVGGANGQKWNAVMISKKIQEEYCIELSDSTIRGYVNDDVFQQKYLAGRAGLGAWRNRYEPIIQRQKPTKKGMLWVIDDSPWELLYLTQNAQDILEKDRGANGRIKLGRLSVLAIVDPYDGECVAIVATDGAITHENVMQCIRIAYRNKGYLAYQIVRDHGSAMKGKGMKEYFEVNFEVSFNARVHNARSKWIEQWFDKMWERSKVFPNWAGKGKDAHSELATANQDWIQSMKKTFPDKTGCFKQISELLMAYNAEVVKSDEAIYEGVKRYDTMTEALNMWEHLQDAKYKDKPAVLEFRNKGYEFTRQGITHRYHVLDDNGAFDTAFYQRHIGTQFGAKWCPESPDALLLMAGDKPVRFAQKMQLAPMAVADMNTGDRSRLDKALASQTTMRNEAANTAKEMRDKSKSMLLIEAERSPVHQQELAVKLEFVGDGEVKKRNNALEKEYLNNWIDDESEEDKAARAARIAENSQTAEYDW